MAAEISFFTTSPIQSENAVGPKMLFSDILHADKTNKRYDLGQTLEFQRQDALEQRLIITDSCYN